MGTGSNVTFNDAVFRGCTLIVRDGARASLERPQFQNMQGAELSVLAYGAGTRVLVRGGLISGGMQAVAVHAGAHFHASVLTISQMTLGAEVRDEGSYLNLTACAFVLLQTVHG